MHNSIMM